MSDAFECDRCGGLESGHAARVVRSAPGGHGQALFREGGERGGELCESCSEAFDAFMNPDADTDPGEVDESRMDPEKFEPADGDVPPSRGGWTARDKGTLPSRSPSNGGDSA